MPGRENPGQGPPPRKAKDGQDPPTATNELKQRTCRICGKTIQDPFPNQYDCLECEDEEQREGLARPEMSEVATTNSEPTGNLIPDASNAEERDHSDLQDDIEDSDLPPIRMKPEDKNRILHRIDGAGNESKFRDLHLDGDWQRYYPEEEYQNPYETAVVGYLRIVAFYTRLSVLHMEAFYRASALFDPGYWEGWNRLNALETALEAQANTDRNWQMYGPSDTVEDRLESARSRLNLIERRMDR